MTAPVVRLDRLTVRYGRSHALCGVSLDVPRGAVYALLGRNGAGKSSAVRCVLGQQRPTSGQVLVLGRDVYRHRAELMARVGVVPEEPDAPPERTALELAALCAPLYPRWEREAVMSRLLRLEVRLDVPFGRLSKGQKAQVLLALALGPAPELLVLDDPTLGLDLVARRALFGEVLDDLAERGTTVLMTTHELAAVEGIATHVGILRDGALLVDAEIEALKARFRRVRLRGRLQPLPRGDEAGLRALGLVSLEPGPFGVELVLSEFDEAAFAEFCKALHCDPGTCTTGTPVPTSGPWRPAPGTRRGSWRTVGSWRSRTGASG
jgi:ABC-2 type transport system ATP-binding protein